MDAQLAGVNTTVTKPYPFTIKLLRERVGDGKLDKSCQSSSLSTAEGKSISVREAESRASFGGSQEGDFSHFIET